MGNHNFNRDFDTGSPSKSEKDRIVEMSFRCDEYRATSYNSLEKKYAFNKLTESCMYRLLRFMPPELKDKVEEVFLGLNKELSKIEDSNLTEQKKQKETIETEFDYFEELHKINMQVLPYSTIEEQTVTGELDITDPEVLKIVRGQKDGEKIPARFSK